jgi:hypothetical protein
MFMRVKIQKNFSYFNFFVINNSEILQFWMIKMQKNQPSILSDLCMFSCENVAEKCVFITGNCLGRQDIQFRFYVVISSHPKVGSKP